MRLRERVAIITGSTGGIGRGAAKVFAREGARVVVNGRDAVRGRAVLEEVRELGAEAIFVQADVSRADDVRRLVETTLQTFGRIDILYNNAGVWDKARDGSVVDISESDWDELIALNLRSVYLTCKYCIPHMVAQGRGVIINTSSIVALFGLGDRHAYCAAKGAIISLTKCIAAKFGHMGVRANVILPGSVRSGMVTEEMLQDPDVVRDWITVCPVPRVGEPEDIAYAAVYLASDEASFVTGACLVVDGGFMAIP